MTHIVEQATAIAQEHAALLDQAAIDAVLSSHPEASLPGNVRRLAARYQAHPTPERRKALAGLMRLHGLDGEEAA